MTYKQLTDELRDKYISQEISKLERKLSGFSVPQVEIAEAAYHNARKRWIKDGYDPSEIVSNYIKISASEKKFVDKIMGGV